MPSPNTLTPSDDGYPSTVDAPGTGEKANKTVFGRALQTLFNFAHSLRLHKAEASITVSGSGLASGGGDLSANRTIAVNYPTDQRFVISAQNNAALRTIPSADFIDGMLSHIAGTTKVLEWDSTSSAGDNDSTVIKPDDVSGNGRWLETTLVAQSDVLSDGIYDKEPLVWDSGAHAWVPADDATVAVSHVYPKGGDALNQVIFSDAANAVRGGVLDYGSGTEAFLDGSQNKAWIGIHDVFSVLKRVVGALYDSSLVKLFFFDGAGAVKQSITGSTASGKADSIAAAGAAYGLWTNSSTAGNGDDPTDTRTFTSTSTTSNLVHHYSLPNDSITRVVVFVAARDTGTLMYIASFSRKFKTVSGGATLLDDGSATLAKDEITVTGATVVASTDGFDVSYGGTNAVHTAGFIKVYMYSDTLVAAT